MGLVMTIEWYCQVQSNTTHRGALGTGGSLLAGWASVAFRSGNPRAAGVATAPRGARGAILAWGSTDAWGTWVTLQTGPTFECFTMKTLKLLPSFTCIQWDLVQSH